MQKFWKPFLYNKCEYNDAYKARRSSYRTREIAVVSRETDVLSAQWLRIGSAPASSLLALLPFKFIPFRASDSLH